MFHHGVVLMLAVCPACTKHMYFLSFLVCFSSALHSFASEQIYSKMGVKDVIDFFGQWIKAINLGEVSVPQ